MSMIEEQRILDALSYDSEWGDFVYKPGVHGKKPGTKAGYISNQGYVRIKLNGKQYQGHRLAWLFYYGEWPDDVLDHINGNRADNRICNLRLSTVRGNNQNRAVHRSGRTVGVRRRGEKSWEATIWYDGKNHHIGTFKTEQAAHDAYRAEVEARVKGKVDGPKEG